MKDGLTKHTYEAVYLPDSNLPDPSKGGFETDEAAWEYIKEHGLCSWCLKELEDGGKWYTWRNDDGVEEREWDETTHPANTACGAEWIVGREDELAEATSFDDVLKAGGWVEISNSEVEDGKS